jgi:cytochrome c553
MRIALLPIAIVAIGAAVAPAPERGILLLLSTAYMTPDLDEETFGALWKEWPAALRERAAAVDASERRRMAFARYGLTPRPGGTTDGPPLQYVVDERGRWSMNCFSCHGGQIAGRAIPGLPNADFALQTFMEDVRKTNRRLGKANGRLAATTLFMPLGGSRGTTNAVNFGIALTHGRDADLNLRFRLRPPRTVHHDMDAPPLWHLRKKSRMYIDGFAAKDHRALMQFILIPDNGPERIRGWEEDFRHVMAWIEELEPPEWPHGIDRKLAERGRRVFDANCASCHGTYGEEETYPERTIPIDVVGTDPVRLEALTKELRGKYGRSWLGRYGASRTVAEPKGYFAPPLDGIWATAPYFHNGSVPTLWHVLHPDRRPAVWRRTRAGYDRDRVGLEVEERTDLPSGLRDPAGRREYFDTRVRGKSADGHRFPGRLTEPEKRAVLEYLKTL